MVVEVVVVVITAAAAVLRGQVLEAEVARLLVLGLVRRRYRGRFLSPIVLITKDDGILLVILPQLCFCQLLAVATVYYR